MADIKVRIEVNPNQETEFLGSIQNQVGTSGSTNNLSNVSVKTDSLAVFQNIPNRQNAISGINGLSLGQDLVFDENGYLDNQDLQGAVIEDEQNPDEFVWGVVPESGEYHVKLTFINAQNLKDIIVKGDDVVGQFPTQAIVDGQTTIYSDDSNWAINLQTESTTHTIEFTHWNRTGYNACLTLIAVMLRYFEIDKYNGLKSVESLSQSTGQPKEIFYGVVPSSGSLEVIDVNGEIADMVNDGVMPNSNVNIDVFANGKQVSNHISVESSYTYNSKMLTMQLSNILNNWNNISYLGYKLNEPVTAYEILVDILSSLYNVYEIDSMLDSIIIGENNTETNVKYYLQSITIQYPYLESSTISEAIEKICVLAQLNVFQEDNGNTKFVSSRPIRTTDMNIIKIAKKNQLSSFDTDIVVNNKYQSVNVKYNQTTLESLSLDSKTIKFFEYETISQKLIDYEVVINDEDVNPGVTLINSYIESANNPDDIYSGNFWYYYIAKFDINYDSTNLKILRNFNITMNGTLFSIFPANTISQTLSDNLITQTITPVDYSVSDSDIIADWLTADGKIAVGTPNLGIKIRKNLNGTLTIFYVSLFLITNRNISYSGVNEDIIVAIYNELGMNFSVPQISQSIISPLNNADVTVEANELLQDTTTLNSENISTIIQNNILEDYKNGISTGRININCLDYYDIYDNKIKDWTKGEILEVGDIVRVDNDNIGNSSIKYKNGRDVYFRITGRTFSKSGVPSIDLELQEVKLLYDSKSFAEDDWSLIETISKTGTAELYYNIGDEKTITLTTGEQVTLQILDFNRDVADNGNVVGITLGAKNLLNTKYPMNTTDTNAGGWQTSAMRTSTMQTIYNQLPSDLRTRVKQVKKQTYNGTSGIVETYDYVWLLSQIELYGRLLGTYEGEGMQYRYWQEHNTDNDRRKLTTSGAESAYWLRSPYTGDNFEFKIVSGSGQVEQLLNAEASWANGGVAFCLCV